MAIVRWEPSGELIDLRRSMERIFDEYLSPFHVVMGGTGTMPLDIYYTDDAMVVKGSLPGVKPENVDITITDNTLSIKGETEEENKLKEDSYVIREHRHGAFSRTVALPNGLDTVKAEASFDNGVLILTIPKSEDKKPKQIKIKAKGALKAPSKASAKPES